VGSRAPSRRSTVALTSDFPASADCALPPLPAPSVPATPALAVPAEELTRSAPAPPPAGGAPALGLAAGAAAPALAARWLSCTPKDLVLGFRQFSKQVFRIERGVPEALVAPAWRVWAFFRIPLAAHPRQLLQPPLRRKACYLPLVIRKLPLRLPLWMPRLWTRLLAPVSRQAFCRSIEINHHRKLELFFESTH
jgi:hypothetical protein